MTGRNASLERQVGDGRTFLFVPADRSARVDKALASSADVVILDLEDSVPVERKEAARRVVASVNPRVRPAMVRIGAVNNEADLALAAHFGVVMVPKATPASLAVLRARDPSLAVVPLVETAAGVAACRDIAGTAGVIRIALGHLDLAAELGVDPEDGLALLWTRSALVNDSAALGLAPPIDGVTAHITDAERVHRDTSEAKRLGFGGKLLIHPAQLDSARQALQPTAAQLHWAERILSVTCGGAFALDGQMVDPPVIRRAQRIAASTRQVL